MDWRCWTVIALLLLAGGVIALLVWKLNAKDARIAALERARTGALEEARLHRDEKHKAVERANAAADAFAATLSENASLRDQLEESRVVVVKRPPPKTIEDFAVNVAVLQRHVTLLDRSLELKTEQVAHLSEEVDALRIAVAAGDQETTALRRVIDYDTERLKLLHKQRRRQKVKAGFLVIGAGLAAGLGGYAVGVSR